MSARYYLVTDASNGTAELNEIMSADWSFAQVTMSAVDSTGASVTIPSGTVDVMFSPFQSGDNWDTTETATYRGIAARVRIVKTGLPGTIAELTVTIVRSGATPAISYVQGYREKANKEGKLFTASRRVTAVAAGGNVDSVMITGSRQVILSERLVGYTGTGIVASIYRIPTYTGGTAADINNPNDVWPQTTTVQLLAGVTVTATGQLTIAAAYSEGNGSNQGQGESQVRLGEAIIMAPNTAYLLRITSLNTTGTQNINAWISWQEDDEYFD